MITLIGSGGSSGAIGISNMVSAPLGADFKNILIMPGMQTQVTTTYTIPASVLSDPITAYDGFLVDLDATMQSVQVTSNPIAMNETFLQKLQRFAWTDVMINLIGIENTLAAVNVTATAHVSFPDDPNVCTSAATFGPFSFSGDVDETPVSESPSVTTG